LLYSPFARNKAVHADSYGFVRHALGINWESPKLAEVKDIEVL
jgi:hypothetical protein